MIRHVRPACLVVLATCFGAVDRATAADLFVGPPGSLAPFTSIQAAVDAASPGDRVFVRAGVYSESVIVRKAIELVGQGPTHTTIEAAASGSPLPSISPALSIYAIGAGERAAVRGFRLNVPQLPRVFIYPLTALSVIDTAGTVELSNIEVLGRSLPMVPEGSQGGIVYLRDVQQVALDGVLATGSNLPVRGPLGGTEGLAGLFAQRANVWVANSSFTGSAGDSRNSGVASEGGPGLLALSSSVHLTRSHLAGAPGSASTLAQAQPGGAGLDARGSYVRVHGGDGARVVGADARELQFLLFWLNSAGGNAVAVDATSAVEFAPDVVLVPGAPSANLPGGQPIFAASGAVITTLTERAPSLAFFSQMTPIGGVSEVQYRGEPGAAQARFLGLATAPAMELPGIEGAFLLDPFLFFFLEVVTLDANGNATSFAQIPSDPWLAGLGVVEQTLQATPQALRFAPPVLKSIAL